MIFVNSNFSNAPSPLKFVQSSACIQAMFEISLLLYDSVAQTISICSRRLIVYLDLVRKRKRASLHMRMTIRMSLFNILRRSCLIIFAWPNASRNESVYAAILDLVSRLVFFKNNAELSTFCFYLLRRLKILIKTQVLVVIE